MPPNEDRQGGIEPDDQIRFFEDTSRPPQETAFGDEARLIEDLGQHRVALYSGAGSPTLVCEGQSVQGVVRDVQALTKGFRQCCLAGTRYADQMDSHQLSLPRAGRPGRSRPLRSDHVGRSVPLDAQTGSGAKRLAVRPRRMGVRRDDSEYRELEAGEAMPSPDAYERIVQYFGWPGRRFLKLGNANTN